jgi:hypothetical protein
MNEAENLLLHSKIQDLESDGYEVSSVTITNQGETHRQKEKEDELFNQWVREKETDSYQCSGTPISLGHDTKIQLMIRKKVG